MRCTILLLSLLSVALCSPLFQLELELTNSSRNIAEDVLEITRGISDLKQLLGEWELWKNKNAKEYPDAFKELYRLKVWSENIRLIQKHNADPSHSHKLAPNQFTDLTRAEYAHLYLRPFSSPPLTGGAFLDPLNLQTPGRVDWREEGFVTAVKNQGLCGSCWSFSATGSLEGQNFRKTGQLVSLSEQNLIDCSGKYGNQGCDGGMMDYAFAYVKNNGGLDTEADYPYGADQSSCAYDVTESGATLRDWVDVQSGNESQLLLAVASQGPVSVAIDASEAGFQHYSSGVYSRADCSDTQLDHGVLVVGYGVEEGHEYWLVKNSWGDSWGEKGYIKMTRGDNNQCGIATMASYPVV